MRTLQIGITVALLSLACGAPKTADPNKATATALTDLTTAMNNFHANTGGWPYANSVWWGGANFPNPQIEPVVFASRDTALFTTASDPRSGEALQACGNAPCWSGPYMVPGTNGSQIKDGWNHALLYAYIRPDDGHGGGVQSQPKGAVVIWSMGLDGIDQTGCSSGACAVNYNDLAAGKVSVNGADDIITLVTTDSCQGSPAQFPCPM